MNETKKRSLLYRIFFKDPVDRQNVQVVYNDIKPAPTPPAPSKSITLVIRNEGVEIIREMKSFPFIIGREYSEGGLHIDNMSVSRRHAVVDAQSNGLTITDANSSNGVEVSGQKLIPGEFRVLKRGDNIKLGRIEIFVMDIFEMDVLVEHEMTERGEYTELLFPKPRSSAGNAHPGVSPTPVAGPTPAPIYEPPPIQPPAPSYDPPPVWDAPGAQPATAYDPPSAGVAAFGVPPAPAYVPPQTPSYDPPPVWVAAPSAQPATAYDPPPTPVYDQPPTPSYDPPPVHNPTHGVLPAPDVTPAPAQGQPPVFCTVCGHMNRAEEGGFCVNCGSKIIPW